MSLALLMFNLNQNEGVIRNINLLKDIVDEVLIVDSSTEANYLDLYSAVKQNSTIQIIRIFPIGYVEPFRMLAIKSIKSDIVLYLDADEEPNIQLLTFLKKLENISIEICGFYVLRYDVKSRFYEYLLRVFRNNCVEFKGTIHETPTITGKTMKLDDDVFILHNNHDESEPHNRFQYMVVESYERPFTKFYLTNLSGGRKFYRTIMTEKNEIIPILSAYLITILETLLTFALNCVTADHLRKRAYRKAKFVFHYNVAKAKFFYGLKERDKIIRIRISEEIIRWGGVIKYLNLDDPKYVENLTKSFRWNKRGVEVFEILVKYRFESGKPLEGFQ